MMNLLRQIQQLLSRDPDAASGAASGSSTGLAVPLHNKPIDTSRESSEIDTIDDDDLTVPELPIINGDIGLVDEPVGFDPYDSAGKPGT